MDDGWTGPGRDPCMRHSNNHNSAVISLKLMIFLFLESSHRAGGRGTVPGRIRVHPEGVFDQTIKDSMFFHEIGLHKPEFDETWAG